MRLGEKQELFAQCLGRLIGWVYDNGMALRMGETFRPPEMAAMYAEQGKGIRNSLHCKKLAADIFLAKNGNVTWDTEDYRELGEFWKSLHPLCRWGGDFKSRDAVHFSIEHGGIR